MVIRVVPGWFWMPTTTISPARTPQARDHAGDRRHRSRSLPACRWLTRFARGPAPPGADAASAACRGRDRRPARRDPTCAAAASAAARAVSSSDAGSNPASLSWRYPLRAAGRPPGPARRAAVRSAVAARIRSAAARCSASSAATCAGGAGDIALCPHRIDASEQLPGRDALAFGHGQLDDLAHRARADIGVARSDDSHPRPRPWTRIAPAA